MLSAQLKRKFHSFYRSKRAARALFIYLNDLERIRRTMKVARLYPKLRDLNPQLTEAELRSFLVELSSVEQPRGTPVVDYTGQSVIFGRLFIEHCKSAVRPGAPRRKARASGH